MIDPASMVIDTGYDLPRRVIEPHDIVFAARIAHEVNRAYCAAHGDFSQLPWDQAPAWQHKTCIDGVRFIVENPKATPADTHANWLRTKHADGWTWGPVKDPHFKKHPCMLDYDQLSLQQRVKDSLFQAAVRTALSL